VSREPALTNVFGFSPDRERVARFFVEVIGLRRQADGDDSVWFEPFLARDPDGRLFGVRQWR